MPASFLCDIARQGVSVSCKTSSYLYDCHDRYQNLILCLSLGGLIIWQLDQYFGLDSVRQNTCSRSGCLGTTLWGLFLSLSYLRLRILLIARLWKESCHLFCTVQVIRRVSVKLFIVLPNRPFPQIKSTSRGVALPLWFVLFTVFLAEEISRVL